MIVYLPSLSWAQFASDAILWFGLFHKLWKKLPNSKTDFGSDCESVEENCKSQTSRQSWVEFCHRIPSVGHICMPLNQIVVIIPLTAQLLSIPESRIFMIQDSLAGDCANFPATDGELNDAIRAAMPCASATKLEEEIINNLICTGIKNIPKYQTKNLCWEWSLASGPLQGLLCECAPRVRDLPRLRTAKKTSSS